MHSKSKYYISCPQIQTFKVIITITDTRQSGINFKKCANQGRCAFCLHAWQKSSSLFCFKQSALIKAQQRIFLENVNFFFEKIEHYFSVLKSSMINIIMSSHCNSVLSMCSSEWRNLSLIKWSNEMLQNLPYFCNKKN